MAEVYGPLDDKGTWQKDTSGNWVQIPNASATGGSIFDGITSFLDNAWDATAGALGTYMDYENWRFDRDMTKANQAAQRARADAETQRLLNGLTGTSAISGQTLMTFAVLGVGALLVWKFVK